MIHPEHELPNFSKAEAQAHLDALAGSYKNDFDCNTWVFEHNLGYSIKIEFDEIVDIKRRYPKWSLTKRVDCILISKLVWLSLAQSTSTHSYGRRLDGIKLLWSLMAERNVSFVTKDMLPILLELFLTHGWQYGGKVKFLHVKSNASFTDSFRLSEWRLALSQHSLNLIADDITKTTIRKQLKLLLPLLSDKSLTYNDWSEGGNYNNLTLDHGQYYVHHCLDFFEKQYALAYALAKTFKSAPQIAQALGYKQTTVRNAMPVILQGWKPEDLKIRWSNWSITTLKNIYEKVVDTFKSEYMQSSIESMLLKDETLKSLIVSCDNSPSEPNIDRMRLVLWDWLRRKNRIKTTNLLEGFEKKISWSDFDSNLNFIIDNLSEHPILIPTRSDYKSLGLPEGHIRDSGSSYPRKLINLVEKSGLVSVAALTGWRKSELGFPFSSVLSTFNEDKLDQYAFPYRYQVDWYVRKTNGKVRILREITFSTFLIIERLYLLTGASEMNPCLYSTTSIKKSYEPGSRVDASVRVMWGHFVNHYVGFQLIDDWELWRKLESSRDNGARLTEKEQRESKRLLSKLTRQQWERLEFEIQLLETRRRVRDEWPRIELFFSRTRGDKKDWLSKYLDGVLIESWSKLLDTHLKPETQEWLSLTPAKNLKTNIVVRTVTNDLIEDTVHPTPHSLRHMWAEAIYRRFDGDIGWMIRSQFKHISQRMWLAYIRDKDNRREHHATKKNVVSSLVHNYLSRQGVGYSGLMHTRLRRLLKKTSVLLPSEQEDLAEQWAIAEIEDLKANPWGYCLINRRTRNKANCAQNGEPMSHNASPDLCLNCIHNLMQSENVEWVLFHIGSHVEALKNPIVPSVFQNASYRLIKKAVRQVRTLDPQHEALNELEPLLNNYNNRGQQ